MFEQRISRLWTFAEARLAPRVELESKDSAFDRDALLDILSSLVNNSDTRYFPLYDRLSCLRVDLKGERVGIASPLRPNVRVNHVVVDVYHGSDNWSTGEHADEARTLFPHLIPQWKSLSFGCTVMLWSL